MLDTLSILTAVRPSAAIRLLTPEEVRASLGLDAVPKGVWVTRIGEAPEWLPTIPPAGARCCYCHTLVPSGTRCPSCGAPR